MFEPLTVLLSVVISVLIVKLFTPSRRQEIRAIKRLALKCEILEASQFHLKEKINRVAENACSTDELIARAMDTLANHLKLEIIPYKKQATESQILFDVVKLKKHKK